ncbi:uncharacterized protein ACLA_067340 [Aspergillus clavatus NRRL 1]|uniref:Uncharacterized protein n=1 Tax=Aspergillus clavatus (strain ATCC 1007 / CBS 513.65 / DSM 816 / NCTC 3887 / NRRL 1 / QM 1276 / 107) TaxID=344612 RepID=A1CGL6_ASPCL|nr:uncharacterized protein ACLA_067340 [Aspergillus clavatus NRRL 1]EAW11096.1 hypothetical protein ACLA_067340 [Aspergillus clavatus NRRL 1]
MEASLPQLAQLGATFLQHRKDPKITEFNDLFDHITEEYAQAVELYNKADLLGRTLSTTGAPSTSQALNEFNEIESLLCEGQTLKHL